MQAVANVIQSNYPCDISTAVKLGSIQLQITVGDRKPDVHKPGYLVDSLNKFVPEHLMAKQKPELWEEQLFQGHDSYKKKNPDSLKVDYLKLVREWPHYGCTFFKAKYQPEETVFYKLEFEGDSRVGVNQNGIHIVEPREMKIISYSFDQIESWNSDKKMFWFVYNQMETKGTGAFKTKKPMRKVCKFQSKQAELINDLMCDWWDELEYREEEKQSAAASSSSAPRRNKTGSGGSAGKVDEEEKKKGKKANRLSAIAKAAAADDFSDLKI